jgi:hypothetical protein
LVIWRRSRSCVRIAADELACRDLLVDFRTKLSVSFPANLAPRGKEFAMKRKRFSVEQIVTVLKQA